MPSIRMRLIRMAVIGQILVASPSAMACTIAPGVMDGDSLIKEPAVIFTGTATEILDKAGQPWDRSKRGLVINRFAVDQPWKGDVPPVVDVESDASGHSCSWAASAGARLLVLARRDASTARLSTNWVLIVAANDPKQRPALEAALRAYRSALESFDQDLARSGERERLLRHKAAFLEAMGDLEGAYRSYAEAGALPTNSREAMEGQGRTLFKLGKLEEAKPFLQKMLTPWNRDSEIKRMLDQARIRTGDLSDVAEADFTELRMDGLSLSGRSLVGRSFDRARLTRVVLVGADLTSVLMRDADISGNFERASLVDADLIGSRLGAVLRGADLRGAKLDKTSFFHADFSAADLRNASGRETNFEAAQVGTARFEDARLPQASFRAAKAADADFANARLDRARFDGADLRGAKLGRASLDGATFEGARYDCRTTFPAGFDPGRQLMMPTERDCGGRESKPDFTGREVKHMDFSGLDLRGVSFRNARVAGHFMNANLDRADFSGARVGGQFSGASLRDANFSGARLNGLFFGGDLPPADLAGAVFRGVRLSTTTFGYGMDARVRPADATRANLRGAILSCRNPVPAAILPFQSGALFESQSCSTYPGGPPDLTGHDLRNLDLQYVLFEGVILDGADLRGAYVGDSDLTKASLRGAKLTGMRYNSRTRLPPELDRAKATIGLVYAQLVNEGEAPSLSTYSVYLPRDGSEIVVPTLAGADLSDLHLVAAWLEGGDLRGAILRQARLKGANLRAADLTNANLRGADLTLAHLEGAELRGTIYDAATKWPSGYDPTSAGAVLAR